MKVYFIATNEHTGPFQESSYIHSHQELRFEVALRNGDTPALVVKLPLETNLNREFLVRLAKSTLIQDAFEESYLGFDGSDPDYAYTFEEILERLGLKPEFIEEGDAVVIRGTR